MENNLPYQTAGGYTCPSCKAFVPVGVFHSCPAPVSIPTPFAVGPIQPLPGWECPICGTGNNPHRATCGNSLCPDMLYKDEVEKDISEEELDQAKKALRDEK
jgi:hypothetical protein